MNVYIIYIAKYIYLFIYTHTHLTDPPLNPPLAHTADPLNIMETQTTRQHKRMASA